MLAVTTYHSAKDSLDFENGAHNFEKLFEVAKDFGPYVLFRPGPYVNAEASASGFPGWVTTGAYGTLRNNDTRYTIAWSPYIAKISQIIAKHQSPMTETSSYIKSKTSTAISGGITPPSIIWSFCEKIWNRRPPHLQQSKYEREALIKGFHQSR